MEIEKVLNEQNIIHVDPEIMSGVPVFVGSRVPLQTLFDYLEEEDGLEEFIDDFPYLKHQAIQVLQIATKMMIQISRDTNAYTAR